MKKLLHVGDNLDIDLDNERWMCGKCQHDIGAASDNVKKGLLVQERNPTEIHQPLIDEPFNFAPNPEWIRILEFYCPGCGLQIETEYLPPGHPITNTTEIDIRDLKRRLRNGELVLNDGHVSLGGGEEE